MSVLTGSCIDDQATAETSTGNRAIGSYSVTDAQATAETSRGNRIIGSYRLVDVQETAEVSRGNRIIQSMSLRDAQETLGRGDLLPPAFPAVFVSGSQGYPPLQGFGYGMRSGLPNSDGFNYTQNPLAFGWTSRLGTWKANGSAAVIDSASIGYDHATRPCGADGSFQVRVAVDPAQPIGLVVRWSSASNWIAWLSNNGVGSELLQMTAGVPSSLFSDGGYVSAGGLLKVVALGSSLGLYRSGSLITTVIGVTFNQTASRAGPMAYYLGFATAALDDWSYTP